MKENVGKVDNYLYDSYRITWSDFSKNTEQNKPVKLYEFDVWEEGFAATGQRGEARFLGKLKGRNFQDACMRYFLKRELEFREEADKSGDWIDTERWDYNPYRNTYWGCNLYDNEIDARKSFG